MTRTLTFRTKADIVYEKVREQILSGELQPGDRVPINHVARALGVSDIPAREGVKRLEADGLLSFTTHKGAVVTQMGHHEVEELFAIRTELEALALRQAAPRITAEELRELRAIIDAMAEAERAGDAKEYGRLNREFHLRAYAAQPYQKLCTMIESLWDSSDWCRRIFHAEASSLRASLAEHEAMYEALARGDGEAASVFLRAQKHRAAAWLLEHIEAAQPEASPADDAQAQANKVRRTSSKRTASAR
jgi:DNA-binding GntR family transcriptional regulator